MNNSKKIKAKKVKEVKLSEKPITSIKKPWLIAALSLIVILIGVLLFDQLYSPTLMKIDGKKYNQKDLAYYFYSIEANYNYYDQILGGGYWNMAYDEDAGTTMRDRAKEEAIEKILMGEILYNEAVAQGYELTDEEKDTIATDIDSLLGQLNKDVIKKNGFTNARLTDVMSKISIADRFKLDRIEELDIDEDAVKAEINYEDYRQYDFEYIFISTQTTDEDGNTVDLSDEEKAAALDKIKSIYDKAKSTEDWSTLISEDEEDLTYNENGSFVVNDGTYSEDFESMMVKMKNGEVSDVYTDTAGYYIVRMINNNSTEAYDNEVNAAINEAQEAAFQEYYQANILPKHTYSLNDKALDKLEMGSITIINN